jgi:hypothetical protein
LGIELATSNGKIQVSYDVQDKSKRVSTCGCAHKRDSGQKRETGIVNRDCPLEVVQCLLMMSRHDVGPWVSYSFAHLWCIYITASTCFCPASKQQQPLNNPTLQSTSTNPNQSHLFQLNFYTISNYVRNDGQSQDQGRPGDAQGQDPWYVLQLNTLKKQQLLTMR